VATYLDAILQAHRSAASADDRDPAALLEQAAACPAPRGFAAAIRRTDGLAVIAEVKRRSPSKGDLAVDLDARELARTYRDAGASCLSVLTDVDHFGGSVGDLVAARSASGLPVIRKDFTVSVADVCDARIMGADCVLLIVAALSDGELGHFASVALELGLDVLVEVHDVDELDRALAAVPPVGGVGGPEVLVGVNQRDLVTFRVDQERAVRVAASIPPGLVRVAESGVRGERDAVELRRAGYDAVLVGEHLVTSADPGAALAALRVGAERPTA